MVVTPGPCTDTTVANGAVRLATTDFGGNGPGLVLMHGLGASRRLLATVASRLDGWRVITMDLRGHGDSTTAPWDFPGVVSDLEAVVRHYQLASPWVGGHSLGGMVALQYALSGRQVSGVVNLDGWGPGVAERFLGEDATVVAKQLDRFGAGLPLAARLLTAFTRQSREGTTRQVLRLLHGADVVAWHRDAPCPSLAVNAIAPPSKVQNRLLGAEMARLQIAHRRGLQRDLAAVARQRPTFSVVEVDTTHALVTDHPASVAAINAFRERVLEGTA
jgi:pimeloyl-ACP methyl ester carboxylesterase